MELNNKQRKMAVRIAKDVIKQLDGETLVARHAGYTIIPGLQDEAAIVPENNDLRDYLRKLAKKKRPCTVCALGACFLADVRRRDNFSVNDEISRISIVDRLSEIFGEAQLDLIECAYEGDPTYVGNRETTAPFKEGYCAVQFGEKHRSPDKRLRAIMRNIIANNGEFLPTGIKKIRREAARAEAA